MVYCNMELRRDTQIESILEDTQRNARNITTAISHTYSSHRCYSLQASGAGGGGGGGGGGGISLLETFSCDWVNLHLKFEGK